MKEEYLAIIEKTLDEVLPKEGERPAELSEAMRYAVGAGGKRIRPLICLASAVAVGGKAEDARCPAAAIELLHNYTLVHDDLPAMDNDTERRGKPSVWAKFGEANAILAGDALQALAFKAAANAPLPHETLFEKGTSYGRNWKDITELIEKDKLLLPDRTYVVRLAGSPFFPSPLASRKTYETAEAVVAGRIADDGGKEEK